MVKYGDKKPRKFIPGRSKFAKKTLGGCVLGSYLKLIFSQNKQLS